jgi:alpha-L-fucosidase 2
MNIKLICLSIVLSAGCIACTNEPVRIACLGDSITEGGGTTIQSRYAWPVVLDSILGSGYSVLNCGRSGATMLKKSKLPIWDCNEFSNLFAFEPDIVLIKLGTNDSKSVNWIREDFIADYQSMIDTLKTLPGKPKLIICLPVPAYSDGWGISDSVIREAIIPSLTGLAEQNQLQTIDMYSSLSGKPEFFPDGIHPNNNGARAIAETAAAAILKK